MNDEKSDETPAETIIQRASRLGVAKATIPLDRQILDLKEIWELMRPEDRSILKSWVEQLIPVQQMPVRARTPVTLMSGEVTVKLHHPRDDYPLDVNGLRPLVIAKAIEAWEKGEEFAPGKELVR